MEKFNKVARITLYFWIMKILATTLGEITGDFFSMTLNMGYVISLLITLVFLGIVFGFQIKAEKFHAVLYWLVIVGTTTVGTEISDLMDRTLGLGYTWGSLILFIGLMSTLLLWNKREGNLTIYPIVETRVEVYYWIAILFSNSLGTAFGDYLSDVVGLSYLVGAAVTAGIIGIVLLLHYYTKLNHIFLFWIAFIFTRPFGATFGDLLTKPTAEGGLHFGRGIAAIVTAVLLGLVVWYSRKKDKRSNNNKQSFA